MYGDAAFSEAPFASLPARPPMAWTLSGTCVGSASVAAGCVLIRHKSLVATGSRGNHSTLKLHKGNFTDVTRIDANNIEATIVQGGRTRTGSILDPNGIVSYKLIETRV